MAKKKRSNSATRKTERQPKISVLIFSYNFEKYLEECIESILAQTLRPYEIIISDDHSQDGSWDIIQRYAKKYPGWIKAFRQEKNMGNVYNGISARARVTGDLQSEIDGDDKWMPEKLEAEWLALQKNPDAKIAYSNVVLLDQHGKVIRKYIEDGDEAPQGDVFVRVFAKRFFRNTVSLFRNELIYRDTYLEFQRDPKIGILADWDLKIRVTAKHPVVYSGKTLVVYRDHPGGIHHLHRQNIFESSSRVVRKNLPLLKSRTAEEKRFVLENLRQLLERQAALSGVNPDQINSELRAPVPPVLVNSLPKAGTNLVVKALRLMPGLQESQLHLGHSTVKQTEVAKGRDAVTVGIDMPRPVKKRLVAQALGAVSDNHIISAHLPWSKNLAALIRKSGLKMLLVLRDPRDVVVSHARYIADTPDHPLHKHYIRLTPDERIMTSITGCEADGIRLESIGRRCASILPWLKEPFVRVVRFEDLVGPQGGGEEEKQKHTLKQILEFIALPLNDDELKNVADRLFGGTGTFRKGQIGAWKNEFNEQHLRAFTKSAGKYLNQMGYAEEEKITKNLPVQGTATAQKSIQDENLIFLISQPRSGSTLLQRVLGGHSQIHTTAEPWIMLHPLYALKKQGVESEFSFRDAVIGWEDFVSQLPAGEEDYIEALRRMGGYLYRRVLEPTGKKFFLDKTPRYYFIIEELKRVFPKAKFIFLLRNPLAVLASVLETWIKQDWPRLALHRFDLLKAPQLLLNGIRSLNEQALVVRYEDFVRHPEDRLKEICDRLHIPFEKEILRYGDFQAPVGRMGDPVGVQRYRAPSAERLDKWTERLQSAERRLLAEVYLQFLGRETVSAMGYDYDRLQNKLSLMRSDEPRLTEEQVVQVMAPLGFDRDTLTRFEPLFRKYVALSGQTSAPATHSGESDQQRNNYLVSAVVSTYNSEDFIAGCLESLVNQTLYRKGQLEIIVIDSNSPQNEGEIVRRFQQKYDHIKYVRTPQRETVYEAWNRGIRMASGKYVTNANTDDRLRADAIETLANLLEENPDKAIAYGNSLVTTKPNETFENNTANDVLDWPDFKRETMLSYCYIGPHPVWRKSLHDEIGYFDTNFKTAADWDFWIRVALKYDLIHLNEYVGLYYLDKETVSQKGTRPLIEAQMVRKKYRDVFRQLVKDVILPAKLSLTSPEQKNILLVSHNFPPFWFGGTESYVYHQAKQLQKDGWNVHVLFPHVDQLQPAPELRPIKYEGIQTWQLWYDGSAYTNQVDHGGEQLLQLVNTLLAHNDYQMVHIHHFYGLPLLTFFLFKKRGLPVAVTLHDFTPFCYRHHFFVAERKEVCDGPAPEKCMRCLKSGLGDYFPQGKEQAISDAYDRRLKLAARIVTQADLVTVPSEYVARKVKEIVADPNLNLIVQPLGIPEIRVANEPGKGEEITFGFLGTLTQLKNVPFMIRAFRKLTGKARLKIWGAGESLILNQVREAAQQDDRISYHGSYRFEDIPQIVAQMDVVVIPSFTESYSMVVREAFAAGRPVIAARVGALPEIVRHGKNGLLFDPKKEQELVNRMQRFLRDPGLIERLRRNIPPVPTQREDFDWWRRQYLKLSEKAALNQAAQRKPKIGYLALEPSVFACPRIRLHGPLQKMAEKGWIEFVDISRSEARDYQLDVNRLRELEVLIVQRNFAAAYSYRQLVNILGENRPKIVYEFDDAFDRLPPEHPGYAYYQKMKENFEEYIRQADLVTVSTEVLREYYRPLNERMVVLPNTLNEEIWQPVKKSSRKRKNSPARILFAGTKGHESDLAFILEPLVRILKEYGNRVELLLWGNELPELRALPNVRVLNSFRTSYLEYARILRGESIDLALVPLTDHPFNRAKSHIKWLEYSACGIPGIYSDIPAYRQAIEHGQTGLIVGNDPQEWETAIRDLIEHPQKRKRIAQKAMRAVRQNHTLERNLHLWREAYRSLLPDAAEGRKTAANETEKTAPAPTAAAPDVSIITPLFNKKEFTERFVQSVINSTDNISYELIFIDNGSTDGTRDYLRALEERDARIRVILNERNEGFARANNQGAAVARGRYLLFMNNDMEVKPGWLEPMVRTAQQDERVGAVGAKLLFPDGTIQHAGVVIVEDRKNGDPLLATHNFYKEAGDKPQANRPMVYQALTAACLLVPAELFSRVGGFDTGFWNGYEDVDLCFRIQQQGYLLVYQPQSEIIHYESQSGGQRWTKVKENIQRLHQKWLGKITPDLIVAPDGSQRLSEQSRVKPYHQPAGQAVLEDEEEIMVSIIMLTYNALEFTRQAVDSVLNHTHIPYELIIVDNGSTDGTVEYLDQLQQQNPQVRAIFNAENKGFAAGNNQGAMLSRGKYVLFLNNDVLVHDGWLDSMVRALETDERIGMVGPITNYISGRQMVKDVPYRDVSGFPAFAERVREVNRGKVLPRRRIAGFAMLMPKQLFAELGGFDESFGTGNYEDDDLCLRVREKGYAIMVDESTYIHHFGSRTFEANRIDYKQSLKEKGNRFKEKWPQVDYQELLEMKNPLPEWEERLVFQAGQAMQQNDMNRARELYAEILEFNPIHVEALFGAALACNQAGDPQAAMGYLNRLVRLQPNDALVFNQIGVAFMKSEDYLAAKNAFARAVEIDPQYVEAQRNYADALIESGDYQNGILALQQIVLNHPDDVPALIYLTRLNMEVERWDEARVYLDKARQVVPDHPAVRQVAEILEREAGQPAQEEAAEQPETQALDRAAQMLEQGRLNEAAKIYRRVLKENPQEPSALFGLGLICREQEKFEQAQELFHRLIELDAKFKHAYNHLGQMAFQFGRMEEAREYFSKSLEIDPTQIDVRNFLSDVLIAQGEYDLGVNLLVHNLKDAPDDVQTLIRMGLVHHDAGKTAQSKQYFKRALELEPGNEVARQFMTK